MRVFSKISPAVWQSSRFNSLPSDDGRYLYLYLLTNTHQNSAGCYRLPDGYACSDLRWDRERYYAARDELVAAEMIRFDVEHNIVMVERWFKHNPPTSEDHLKGIDRLLQILPPGPLQEASQQCAVEACEAFCLSKQAKHFGKGLVALTPARSTHGASLARMETPYLNRGGR